MFIINMFVFVRQLQYDGSVLISRRLLSWCMCQKNINSNTLHKYMSIEDKKYKENMETKEKRKNSKKNEHVSHRMLQKVRAIAWWSKLMLMLLARHGINKKIGFMCWSLGVSCCKYQHENKCVFTWLFYLCTLHAAHWQHNTHLQSNENILFTASLTTLLSYISHCLSMS